MSQGRVSIGYESNAVSGTTAGTAITGADTVSYGERYGTGAFTNRTYRTGISNGGATGAGLEGFVGYKNGKLYATSITALLDRLIHSPCCSNRCCGNGSNAPNCYRRPCPIFLPPQPHCCGQPTQRCSSWSCPSYDYDNGNSNYYNGCPDCQCNGNGYNCGCSCCGPPQPIMYSNCNFYQGPMTCTCNAGKEGDDSAGVEIRRSLRGSGSMRSGMAPGFGGSIDGGYPPETGSRTATSRAATSKAATAKVSSGS